MTHLVIGLGEVGKALQRVLNCDGLDALNKQVTLAHSYEVLHICFPYRSRDEFEVEVREYREKFEPLHVVVHSTVPVGTCRELGVLHSPVRGAHPNLEEGLRTFVKLVAGDAPGARERIVEEFRDAGIPAQAHDNTDDTEAAKLWDTAQYGVMILLNKEIKKYCEEHELDFDVVYSLFNKTYNEGYRELGRPEVVRPHLLYMPGKIGGHCVVENAQLLESPTADRIIRDNRYL